MWIKGLERTEVSEVFETSFAFYRNLRLMTIFARVYRGVHPDKTTN
jgi:hypothetical protein